MKPFLDGWLQRRITGESGKREDAKIPCGRRGGRGGVRPNIPARGLRMTLRFPGTPGAVGKVRNTIIKTQEKGECPYIPREIDRSAKIISGERGGSKQERRNPESRPSYVGNISSKEEIHL